MANLSPAELKAWHAAIQEAFSRDELRRLVRFSLNVDLDGEIASANTTLSETAFALLQWSLRVGRTTELLQAVVAERGNNPSVAAAATAVATQISHDPVVVPLIAQASAATRPPAKPSPAGLTGKLHVFISYSTRDDSVASEVVAALERSGVPLWIDRREIRPGDSLVQSINEGLGEAGYVVLLWSRASSESRWVQKEYQATISLGRSVLCPVLLDDTPLPPLLVDLHRVDLRRDRAGGLQKLTAFFEAELRSPSKTGGFAFEATRGDGPAPPASRARLRDCDRRTIRLILQACLDDSQLRQLLWDLGLDPNDVQGNSVNEKLVWLLHEATKNGDLERLLDLVAVDRARCVETQMQKLAAAPA